MKITKTIRNNIIVGLVLLTPIAVSLLVANWIFHFITDVAFLFFPPYLRANYPILFSRLTAFILLLILLFLIGALTRNFLGRKLYQMGDALLRRIPVINKIYVSVRQISEALLDQGQHLFKEVVLVEYPRKGIFVLGFITAPVPEGFGVGANASIPASMVSVFIPTAPNPTSGFVIFVPRSEIIVLPMSVTDAMKLVVSGGAVFPGTQLPEDRPTLLDKLEEWLRRQGAPELAESSGQPKPT